MQFSIPAQLQRRTLAAENGLTGLLARRERKLCAANDESGNERLVAPSARARRDPRRGTYAVIAWLLLQIADVTFAPLEAPKWAMPSLIVAAVLGFPVAVALAWFYEAGEQGIRRDTAADWVIRPVTHGLRRYADVLIIGGLLLYERDWLRAGEAAYEVLARRTGAPNVQGMILMAIRMHARATGDFARARAAVEPISDVSWDAAGRPLLTGVSPLRDGPIVLAELLIKDGQEERGRRLLAEIIGRMNREVRAGRSEYWYYSWHPLALVLNGDLEAAMAMLERSVSTNSSIADSWWQVGLEPAFEVWNGNPRFEALQKKIRVHVEKQRRELERMRAEGLVPDRTSGQQASQQAAER